MRHTFSRIGTVAMLALMVGTSALALVKESAPASPSIAEIVRLDRISFAKQHGCKDPVGMVDSIGDSPLADLLLSVAIQESHCNKDAIGKAGEKGAFQVISLFWGPVPQDLPGQARQAERIILSLLAKTNGDTDRAMAVYNGGWTPPSESTKYAHKVIQRKSKLSRQIELKQSQG